MHEYDSLSVSTFEAASLAEKLSEKSGDGWDVVAIVPAGSDIVAYLKRDTSTSSTSDGDDTGTTAAWGSTAATDAVSSGTSTGASSDTATTSGGWDSVTSSTGDTASSQPAAREPAGWGTAPTASDPSSPTSWGTTSSGDSGPSQGWGATSSGDSPPSQGWGGQQAPAPQSGAYSPAPAAPNTPTVPAGWYTDPAGRYELRYWDGAAWTEHVSRAGQQYTDPPVA